MLKLLFLDTETTGADKDNDLIIQLAAIKVFRKSNNEIIKQEGFNASVKPKGYPNITFDPIAQDITGVTFDDLEKFHQEEKVLLKFIGWLREKNLNLSWDQRYIFVAYNAMFDWRMVYRLFHRHRLGNIFFELFLPTPFDLYTYCFMLNKKLGLSKELKLMDVADQFNVKYNEDELHDALTDTIITRDLYFTLEEQNLLL